MVTLGEARKVIAAAEQKAAEIKQPMNIAVVDAGGPYGRCLDRQYRHLY